MIRLQFALGLIFLILGILVWKLKLIDLIKSKFRSNVDPEDYPAFTRSYGIGFIITGSGIILSAVGEIITGSMWFGFLLVPSIVAGGIKMSLAIRRYNGPKY